MTLEQLKFLSEDEIVFCLYVANFISPTIPVIEEPRNLTWFRKGSLEKKIMESFNRIPKEGHSVFSSLLTKLGVPHEIKYEQPLATPIESISGSL